MSDATEKLQHELQEARCTIAELQAQLANRETGQQLNMLELEENRSALLFMLEDLEAGRKKIEQSHQEWMDALDVMDDPIFLHDKEYRILRCNRAYQQCAGIPFRQIIGQPYYEVFPKTDGPLPCCLRAMQKAVSEEGEEEAEEVAVGETIYRSRSFTVHDEQDVHLYSVHILEDITESRRLRAALSENEEKFRLIFEGALDGIVLVDAATKRFVAGNPAFCQMLGYGIGEAMRLGVADIHPEQALPHVMEQFERLLRGEIQLAADIPVKRKDGSVFYADIKSSTVNFGGNICLLGALRDVTERKQAEQELRLRAQLLDSTNDSVFVHDLDGNFVYLNEVAWKSRGYTRDELMGMNLHVLDVPEREKLIETRIRELMEKGLCTFESAHRRKDGSVMPIEVSARLIESAGGKLIISAARDITERKKAEIALKHAHRALAALSEVNRSLVYATDEKELLQAICRAIVEQRGYRLASVGYAQHDAGKSIKIMASAGHDEGYLEALQLTWAETGFGMGPSGRAIRSGATQLCKDMHNDPRCLPWHDAARQHGYYSCIALPLLKADNTAFGILTVYAEEVNAFTHDEIGLLEEMAGDLAFGVRTLHVREERDLALEQNRLQLVQLESNLEDTVRAIATIVEMRDPYTAGHQARVADLAATIARQMGLTDEQVHGIHLAGVLHDLGKIRIPAEILSKLGRLSDIERNLIMVHPQAGYDILQGINFPWPIAQMVLQHHERVDGSGYPQGLKGDQIIVGASILSVADVVEAISAHRPYRPGLGVEAALEEITRLRGVYYDPRVVDACLAVFREQGYRFA